VTPDAVSPEAVSPDAAVRALLAAASLPASQQEILLLAATYQSVRQQADELYRVSNDEAGEPWPQH
jgi:hypothetical protein